MPLKNRLCVELLVLTFLAVVFLILFPKRPAYVDVLLGLAALSLISLNARFTRTVIWSRFPTESDSQTRARRSFFWVAVVTVPAALAFLTTGVALGYSESGWTGVWERFSNWHILIACVLYFPWALLQQFLFQFYLQGRLLTLLPATPAVVVTGLAYSLVHLPEVGVAAATAAGGIFWTALYYRYRVLTPLALSHSVLGSTFYYWVYGRDLLNTWTSTW